MKLKDLNEERPQTFNQSIFFLPLFSGEGGGIVPTSGGGGALLRALERS